MPSIWAHTGCIALALIPLAVASEICLDGSIPLCSDGSKPQYPGKDNNPACPKACDPHHNTCDATAPTCIFPDPRVPNPRGACACRPGYKATGYANNDNVNQWRLPIESHEHRVWVAEGVKCDTLCDVSTGVDSCLEVSLIGAECVGAGAKGRNATHQSMPNVEGTYGNYSQSMAPNRTNDVHVAYTQPGDSTEDAPEKLAETDFDTDEPAPSMETDGTDDAVEEDVIDDPPSAIEDDSMEASDLPDEGDNPDGDKAPEDLSTETSDEVDSNAEKNSENSEEPPSDDIYEPSANADEPESADASTADESEEDPSTEDVPTTPGDSSQPSVERRDTIGTWSAAAQKKGREAYDQAWKGYMKDFTKAASVIETARRPNLCSTVTRSIVDTCKRGVRTQVAFCKQSLREKIDQCKRDVKTKIDKCKKSKKAWDIRKAACEARYRGEIPKCELARVDVPFCEFDRLTSACCEGYRTQANVMCTAGISASTIQKQIQSIQTTCSIGTGLAKAATKSWLTGQVVGIVTQLQSVKEIGDTVEAIRKADQTRAKVEKWADGLAAAAAGNMQEAQRKLGSLVPQISTGAGDALKWMETAQAAVNKNVDGLFNKAISAAGEIQAIRSAKSSIGSLKNAADDIKAIQAAAKQCAAVPKNITPAGYPQWEKVNSKQKLDSAVEAYKKLLATKLKAAAKCKAVVVRTQRVLGV